MSLPRTVELLATIHTLRSPGGCPWDRRQTLADAARYLMDEAAELLEAALAGDVAHAEEELADLLYMVCFCREILNETRPLAFEDVARLGTEKLVRRHPHVFEGHDVDDIPDILKNWEAIKQSEKKNADKGLFDGIPRSLPEIQRFSKVLHKIERNGGDLKSFEEIPLGQACMDAAADLNDETVSRLMKSLLIECFIKKIDTAHLIRSATDDIMTAYLKKK